MLYIKDKNTLEEMEKRKKFSLEYCIALKQKEFFKDFEIFTIKNENIFFLQNFSKKVFSEDGMISFRIYERRLKNEYPHIDEYYLFNNTVKAEDSELLNANWHIVNEFKNDFKDSHSLVFSKKITDKNGDEYDLKIFENIDSNNSMPVLNDYLLLEKNGKIVGDITIAYSNAELVEKIKNNILTIGLRKISYQAPYFDNDSDALIYAERTNTVLSKDCRYQEDLAYTQQLTNKAFSEYSCVNYHDDLSGLGLGKQMYFYASQHLTKKNITFYSSVLLSDQAEILWKSISKNFDKYTGKGAIFEGEQNERLSLLIPDNVSYENIITNKKVNKIKIKIPLNKR